MDGDIETQESQGGDQTREIPLFGKSELPSPFLYQELSKIQVVKWESSAKPGYDMKVSLKFAADFKGYNDDDIDRLQSELGNQGVENYRAEADKGIKGILTLDKGQYVILVNFGKDGIILETASKTVYADVAVLDNNYQSTIDLLRRDIAKEKGFERREKRWDLENRLREHLTAWWVKREEEISRISYKKLLGEAPTVVSSQGKEMEESVLSSFAKTYETLIRALYGVKGLPEPNVTFVLKEIRTQRKNLEGMFTNIKENNPYFVEDPPEVINLTDEQKQDLRLLEPFFIDITTSSWRTNPEVVPYVYEEIGRSGRFQSAEAVTNGDSGLFALCAVSAEGSEKQARLYQAVASAILDIHEGDPELVVNWLGVQAQTETDGAPSSFNIFSTFDFRQEGGQMIPRPPEETLVTSLFDEKGEISFLNFRNAWKERVGELRKALVEDNLQPHHLRWIEFLSHSVTIPKLFEIIKN